MKTRDVVYMGMYLALFYVLDVLTHMLPILDMPQGGSVGLSVIALLLASYHLGWVKGTVVCLLSILIQYLTGEMYFGGFLGFFLDYILAFGIYGIASVFPKTGYLYWGILITSFIRFVSHTVSGTVVYGSTWVASIAYNGPYMLVTTIVAAIIVPIVAERVKVLK